jgi:hypothetical protein
MIQKLILCILFLFPLIAPCWAQWQSDLRLTNSSGNSSTANTESIAAAGDILHVVWNDDRDGNNKIYYKASPDGGLTWSPDGMLTSNSSGAYNPSVKVSGPDVHVVWMDYRDGNSEIYYKSSSNGGFSWGPDIRLSNGSGVSENPRITVTGAVIHVAWHDHRNGNYEIYYKASGDGGVTWSPDARLTNNSGASQSPAISVSGPDVHLVWKDNRDGNFEIYYKSSSNGGFSWGPDIRLTVNNAESQSPSISTTGDILHVTWQDTRDGNFEIYYKASGDRGVNWSPDVRFTNDIGLSISSSVYVSGPYVHAVWSDNRNGNNEIYYRFSANGGFTWGAETRLTSSAGSSEYPTVYASDMKVHVVWTDDRSGNDEIYHKVNPLGNQVGVTNINSEVPENFSLSQNYPNPFNPTTNIKFSIPKTGFVRMIIYDLLGREVAELMNLQMTAGNYNVDFDASTLAAGVYFYKLETEGFTGIKKMILIK